MTSSRNVYARANVERAAASFVDDVGGLRGVLMETRWVRVILACVMLGEVWVGLSRYSVATMYAVAGCGVFRCENWLYTSAYYNADCNARGRYAKVAQIAWGAAVFLLCFMLHRAHLGRLPTHPQLLLTATAACLCALCHSFWFYVANCRETFALMQDSHLGPATYLHLATAGLMIAMSFSQFSQKQRYSRSASLQ